MLAFFNIGHASEKLSPKAAVKSIKNEFLGYSEFNGLSADGTKCKISILDLEGVFGGIQVRITGSNNQTTAVSIDSSNLDITKSISSSNIQSTTIYEIYDEESQDSSLIGIAHHEDTSDFVLELMPSVLNNKSVSCSYFE
jgi:hypothetical protein